MKTDLYSGAARVAAAPLRARYGQKDDSSDPGSSADVAEAIKSLGEKMATKIDQLKADQEKLKADSGATDAKFKDYKDQVDERLNEIGEISASLKQMEQKLARSGGEQKSLRMTPGQAFVKSDKLKAFAEKRTSGRVSIEFDGTLGVKDISSVNDPANTPGSAGALLEADRRGLIAPVERRMTIRSLLQVSETSQASIEYERETAYSNNAAQTAEDALAPESLLTFEDKEAKVVDITHFMRAPRSILDDVPRLRSYIDGRLRYGLAYKEELMILLGDGQSGNMEGLVTAADAYAPPTVDVAVLSKIDILRLAMLQTIVDEYAPTGIVLNHVDWAGIELTKDSQGRYIIGGPQFGTVATLWNLPVVPTNAMTADNFLVGDFAMAAELFDRMQSTVEASTEDADNFRRRKVSILGMNRIALPIYRPDALVTGSFNAILNP